MPLPGYTTSVFPYSVQSDKGGVRYSTVAQALDVIR